MPYTIPVESASCLGVPKNQGSVVNNAGSVKVNSSGGNVIPLLDKSHAGWFTELSYPPLIHHRSDSGDMTV
jgi:hypothetical protein